MGNNSRPLTLLGNRPAPNNKEGVGVGHLSKQKSIFSARHF